MKTKARQPFHSLPAVGGRSRGDRRDRPSRLPVHSGGETLVPHRNVESTDCYRGHEVRQLVAWREERLGDAKVIQFNPFTHRRCAKP